MTEPVGMLKLVAVAAASGLMVAASVAFGSNFGSVGTTGVSGTTNGVWLTDDDLLVVAMRALTTPVYTGVLQTISNDYNGGIGGFDAVAYFTDTCPYESYDVCAFDSDYGDNGLAGWNACWGSTSGNHPNQVCSTQFVKFNLYYNSLSPQALACHEIGHSVGLRHSSQSSSCMKSPPTSDWLTSHDRYHIQTSY
jgi:hypothetical protein